MNSENQNNENLNNGGMNSFALGAAPNVAPQQVPTPNMGMGPTPMAGPGANPVPQAPAPNEVIENIGSNPMGNPTLGGPEPLNETEPFVANTLDQMPQNPGVVGNTVPNPTPVNPTPGMNVNPSMGPTEPNPTPNPVPNSVPNPNMGPTSFTPNNLGPIEQPIPGTTYAANGNVNSNGFVEPNKVENIGTEAPQPQNNKEKKPMNKILFIIIIIILIAAIAYGVYYYLSLGKRKTNINVTTNNLQLSVNDVLSSNINDYATITGTDPKNCVLSTSNVDMSMEGNYEYTVTCEDNVYRGIITVTNNNIPTVTTKEIITGVATDTTTSPTYEAIDFIEENSCTANNCTYTFAENYDFSSLLKVTGNYSINIVITDDAGKTGNAVANLIVLDQPIRLYLNCTKTDDNVVTTDHIAFGSTLEFINYGYRVSEFTIMDDNEFQGLLSNKSDTISYNGVTGKATIDEANKKLSIRSELNGDILNSEAGGTFPVKYQEVSPYYQAKGYTCTMEAN